MAASCSFPLADIVSAITPLAKPNRFFTMDDAEIERLSTLSGVSDFDDWQRQTADSEARIDTHLTGDVRDAWGSCLPIWASLERANDLSRRIRVPKYWPSFATLLAREFADRFCD